MGDSLSASYNMDYEQGWVPLLQASLQAKDQPIDIINASISGETSGGGASRLERLLHQHQPDILWIELGGNDGLRGYPPKRIASNLKSMIETAQAKDITVWLTQIEIHPNYGPRYTEQFRSVFTRLADSYSLPLLPFPLEDIIFEPEMMMPDGIHPSVQAQPLIAEKMHKILLDLVNVPLPN